MADSGRHWQIQGRHSVTDTGKTFSGRQREDMTQGRHSVADTGKTLSDRYREYIQWQTQGRHSVTDTGKTFSGRHRKTFSGRHREDIGRQGKHSGRLWKTLADTGKAFSGRHRKTLENTARNSRLMSYIHSIPFRNSVCVMRSSFNVRQCFIASQGRQPRAAVSPLG